MRKKDKYGFGAELTMLKNKTERTKNVFNGNIGSDISELKDSLKELKYYSIDYRTKKPGYAQFDEEAYQSMVNRSLEDLAKESNDNLKLINSTVKSSEDAKLFISHFIAQRHIAELSDTIENFRGSEDHKFFYATMQMALTGINNSLDYSKDKEDTDARIKKLWEYIFIIENGMQCSDLVTGLSYLSVAFKDLDKGVSASAEKYLNGILEGMEWLTNPIEIMNLERKEEKPKSKKKSDENENNDMYS